MAGLTLTQAGATPERMAVRRVGGSEGSVVLARRAHVHPRGRAGDPRKHPVLPADGEAARKATTMAMK